MRKTKEFFHEFHEWTRIKEEELKKDYPRMARIAANE